MLLNLDVGAFARHDAAALPLELAVSAVDQTGRQSAFARQTVTVTFTPDGAARVPEVNVQTYVDLPPGDYEIRVAVADPATNLAASVFGPVAIPPFGGMPLSFSDVIVESASGQALAVERPPQGSHFFSDPSSATAWRALSRKPSGWVDNGEFESLTPRQLTARRTLHYPNRMQADRGTLVSRVPDLRCSPSGRRAALKAL